MLKMPSTEMPAPGMGTDRSCFSYWRLAGLKEAVTCAWSPISAMKLCGIAIKVSALGCQFLVYSYD